MGEKALSLEPPPPPSTRRRDLLDGVTGQGVPPAPVRPPERSAAMSQEAIMLDELGGLSAPRPGMYESFQLTRERMRETTSMPGWVATMVSLFDTGLDVGPSRFGRWLSPDPPIRS